MPRVVPFRSLVYDPAVAGPLDRVTAPTYDVITEARLRELLLPPTMPARVREVEQRGQRLPQKSTYFWAQPRTGMVPTPLEGVTPD